MRAILEQRQSLDLTPSRMLRLAKDSPKLGRSASLAGHPSLILARLEASWDLSLVLIPHEASQHPSQPFIRYESSRDPSASQH